MIRAFNRQHDGQLQFIDLPGKERNCFKAGLGFGRAASERRKVGQAVIIRQIAEGETVGEQNRHVLAVIYSILILVVQFFQLRNVARRVFLIGRRIGEIQLAQRVGDGLRQRLRIAQR